MPELPQWTPEEKLTAVLEAVSLSGGALEAFLRRRGLQQAHVEQWRRQMLEALRGQQAYRASAQERQGPSPASFLARILAVIDEHLAEDRFQVGDLARCLAVSRSLLFQRLKELDQPPPARLILDRRLRRAAELLVRDEGSINDVAYAVGFGSASSFAQSFRKHFGLAPSAYRAARVRPEPAVLRFRRDGFLDDRDRGVDESDSPRAWVSAQ